MADATINYFDLWAPYWSYLEDNYLNLESINKLASLVNSPALVVGAGQGIIVEQLRKNGLEAAGVDLSPQMIKYAKQRRGIDIIEADARAMPFDNEAYQSTIIATGVIDFMDDEKLIKQIINEVIRVTANSGEVLIAFYHLHPRVEELMRYVGLITKDDRWCFKRTYELLSLKPIDLFAAVRKIPNISMIGAFLALMKMQILLPKKEKEMSKNYYKAWEKAKQELENPRALIETAPEYFPYRNESQIRDLFSAIDIPLAKTHRLYSCTVAQVKTV